MSDTSIRARLTKALTGHGDTWHPPRVVVPGRISAIGYRSCTCGTWMDDHPSAQVSRESFAAHLADVLLALPGVAIVELPEPCEITVSNCAWWLAGDVTAMVGSRRVRCHLDDPRMSSDNARELAAALIAAAQAAERGA